MTNYLADQHREGHPGHDPQRAAEGERGREGGRHPRGHRAPDGRRHVEETSARLHSARSPRSPPSSRRSFADEHFSPARDRSDAENFDNG